MLKPGATMAGRVLERKRGAGRPPGPRDGLVSVLHSTTGMLKQTNIRSTLVKISWNHRVTELVPRRSQGFDTRNNIF